MVFVLPWVSVLRHDASRSAFYFYFFYCYYLNSDVIVNAHRLPNTWMVSTTCLFSASARLHMRGRMRMDPYFIRLCMMRWGRCTWFLKILLVAVIVGHWIERRSCLVGNQRIQICMPPCWKHILYIVYIILENLFSTCRMVTRRSLNTKRLLPSINFSKQTVWAF